MSEGAHLVPVRARMTLRAGTSSRPTHHYESDALEQIASSLRANLAAPG
jgi:hypothetical protein